MIRVNVIIYVDTNDIDEAFSPVQPIFPEVKNLEHILDWEYDFDEMIEREAEEMRVAVHRDDYEDDSELEYDLEDFDDESDE